MIFAGPATAPAGFFPSRTLFSDECPGKNLRPSNRMPQQSRVQTPVDALLRFGFNISRPPRKAVRPIIQKPVIPDKPGAAGRDPESIFVEVTTSDL
jgi:hypothetical protein